MQQLNNDKNYNNPKQLSQSCTGSTAHELTADMLPCHLPDNNCVRWIRATHLQDTQIPKTPMLTGSCTNLKVHPHEQHQSALSRIDDHQYS